MIALKPSDDPQRSSPTARMYFQFSKLPWKHDVWVKNENTPENLISSVENLFKTAVLLLVALI